METSLYQRIKDLCSERGTTIKGLEKDLGFGESSIRKWEKVSSPSVDKIMKVAAYFNVSIDYLLGRTEIRESISDVLGDEDVISFQRAKEKMTPQDRQRMMSMLVAGFDYAFGNNEFKG